MSLELSESFNLTTDTKQSHFKLVRSPESIQGYCSKVNDQISNVQNIKIEPIRSCHTVQQAAPAPLDWPGLHTVMSAGDPQQLRRPASDK